VSIPRDIARFPLPDGGTYGPKVNGLYQHYIAKMGRGKAGQEMKRAVGSALGVEIDYYAVVGFQGVRELVDAVGGVEVQLAKAVSDPYYWVTSTNRGVYFPAGVNKLTGERALIFARTRKGDNDYERARRQQLLVAAAVAKVQERGIAVVPDLVRIGTRWVMTDLPLAKTLAIFDMAGKADLATDQKVVFGPTKWASQIGGTSSYQLKLDVVRRQIDAWMPAVTPPPSPSPSPNALPSAAASPSPSIGASPSP
jgi:LCP family protein required for cell wall assembly